MHQGYLKLWRRSLGSPVWKNPNLWRFFTFCLLRASYKPRTIFHGCCPVRLDSGQFIFGRDSAARETGLSPQTIRTCLTALSREDGGEPMLKTTTHPSRQFSIITVCNWSKYQDSQNRNNQPSGQPSTNLQPQTRRDRTVQEDQENHSSSAGADGVAPSSFDRFWGSYPRKVGKQAAFRAFKVAIKRATIDVMLSAIEKQKQSDQWRKDKGQFIPHPTTWLNQGRWDDEITAALKKREDKYANGFNTRGAR